MLVTPDPLAARRAEDALWHATDAVLRRAGAGGSAPPLRHPARKAAAHRRRHGTAARDRPTGAHGLGR